MPRRRKNPATPVVSYRVLLGEAQAVVDLLGWTLEMLRNGHKISIDIVADPHDHVYTGRVVVVELHDTGMGVELPESLNGHLIEDRRPDTSPGAWADEWADEPDTIV